MRRSKFAKRIGALLRAEIVEQLASADPHEYGLALEKLERFGSELGSDRRVGAVLSTLLEHEDPWFRERAALALSRIGASRATYAAVVRALSDGNSAVRDYACQALGGGARRQAIPHLKRMLVDRDEQVRSSALEAYAGLGGEPGTRELRRLLRDGSPLVRLAAVRAVQAFCRSRRSLRPHVSRHLADLLKRERDDLVRCDALAGLYAVDGDEATLRRLFAMGSSPRGLVRLCVAERLEELANRTNIEVVMQELGNQERRERVVRSRRRIREIRRQLRERFDGPL